MTIRPFLHFPPPPADPVERRRYEVLQQMRRGKLEITTTVTLTPGAATTTLQYLNLSPQSAVFFDPMTANAAAELYGGTMYVLEADRGDGSWVITHANNAQTDRKFVVCCLG